MMKLYLVKCKTAYEAAAAAKETAPSGYVNHGTKVLKDLVEPWSFRGQRVVAVDSQFASVQPEKSLEEMGLGLICVVNQALRQYPISNLQRKYFTHRGYCYGLGYGVVE